MLKTIVRLERAALHPGVGLIFTGRGKEVLAQVPLSSIEPLLGPREKAFYEARLEPNGPIHLGEEIPEESVP